jgi:hypothetical protein
MLPQTEEILWASVLTISVEPDRRHGEREPGTSSYSPAASRHSLTQHCCFEECQVASHLQGPSSPGTDWVDHGCSDHAV